MRLSNYLRITWRERAISPYVVLSFESLGTILDRKNILPENIYCDDSKSCYLIYSDRNSTPSQIGLACSKNMREWEDLGHISILNNENAVLDAPHIMRYRDSYFLFFARVDDMASMTKRIYLAESEEIVGPYKQRVSEPVLDTGKNNEFDSGRVDEPFVIFDGELFHMLYMGAPWWNINREQVGYARANRIEGPWIKARHNPVLRFCSYDEFTVADPHILKVGEIYLIFYACSGRITGARSYGSSPWVTGVAYTEDFKTYKKLGLVRVRVKDFSKHRSYFRGACLIKDDKLWFVYTGQDHRRIFHPMLAYTHVSALNFLPALTY